jgi:hypothetical protein
MADDLRRWYDDKPLRILIALIGVHSLVLGIALLTATRLFLSTFGFDAAGSIFFPTQSGVFLLIMGVLYVSAVRVPQLVWTILLSKGFAVPFLLVHLLVLNGPPSLWLALAGDAGMLLAVVLLLLRHQGVPAPRVATHAASPAR